MFYGLGSKKEQDILQLVLRMLNVLYPRLYFADHLVTMERCMGFLEDKRFMEAVERASQTPQDNSLLWRLHTLTWAGRHCLNIEGDFVDCGVYRGFMSHVLIDYLEFPYQSRTFFLYDTFTGIPEAHRSGSPVREGGYAEEGLYERAKERFKPFHNVRVVQGVVPDVLAEISPDKVAYLHLDMNSASAEVGALEVLFDRITPGGMVVLDDYGWYWYRTQKQAEDAFFEARGHHVLELPTGQGLVVKR